ncbi:MAG: hypothetical protein ISS44_01705 [Candidatus Omnitrophica bacterium]|nr:hypothetical protein [Candidatus Omnitrophota bacterium]
MINLSKINLNLDLRNLDLRDFPINKIVHALILGACLIFAFNIYRCGDAKSGEYSKLIKEQKKTNEITLRIANTERKIKAIRDTFPLKDSQEIMDFLTNLALREDIDVISVRPEEKMSASSEKEPLSTKAFFSLVVELESYHQLGRFISILESAPILFSIEGLNIGRKGEKESSLPFERFAELGLGLGTQLKAKILISVLFLN